MRATLAVLAALAVAPSMVYAQPNSSGSLDTLRHKVEATDIRANTLELEYFDLLAAAHNDENVDRELLDRHLAGLREVTLEYQELERLLREAGKGSAADQAKAQAEIFSSRTVEFQNSLARGLELRKEKERSQAPPPGVAPGQFSDKELRGPTLSHDSIFLLTLLGIGALFGIPSYFLLQRSKRRKKEEEERERKERVLDDAAEIERQAAKKR